MKSIKNKRVWVCGCDFPMRGEDDEYAASYIDPTCDGTYYGRYCIINLEGVCIERRSPEHTDLCIQVKGHGECDADSVFCDECGSNIFRLVRHPHTQGKWDRSGYHTPSIEDIEDRLEGEAWIEDSLEEEE